MSLAGRGLPQGLVSDLPVSGMDLPPTLLSLAGLPVPDSWPGRNLLPALAGKLDIGEAFTEWSDEKSEKFGQLARSVSGRRKEIVCGQVIQERFEIAPEGPTEMQGTVASEGVKGIRQVLSREFARDIGPYEYSHGPRDLASMPL